MNKGIFALAAAVLALAGEAVAQPTDESGDKEITVEAPRAVPKEAEPGEPRTGDVLMTLRLGVLYGDLNLASPTGAERLMSRVENAARDVCRYLDRVYPLDPDKKCVEDAIARARPLVEQAVAAATAEASH